MTILKHITLETPLNLSPWHNLCPYLNSCFLHISHALIDKIKIEDWTHKQLYQHIFITKHQHTPLCQQKAPQTNWLQVWKNLSLIKPYPSPFSLWYRIIHRTFPTQGRLHELKIATSPVCLRCSQPDSLQHALTSCGANDAIFRKFRQILLRVLHMGVDPHFVFDLFILPDFAYFPKTRHNFIIWLMMSTLTVALGPARTIQNSSEFVMYLRFKLQEMSVTYKCKLFAHYERAIY